MKKLLSLLLALMLFALPLCALAQEEEPAVFVHEDESYSFCYPADWTPIARQTIAEVAEAYRAENNDEVTAMLDTFLPQLEASNMVMIMSPTWQDNINIICTDVGMSLAPEELMALAPTLQSALTEGTTGAAFLTEPTLMQTTEEAPVFLALMYECELAGTPLLGIQAVTSQDTLLYYVTMTVASTDDASCLAALEALEMVMGTFKFF